MVKRKKLSTRDKIPLIEYEKRNKGKSFNQNGFLFVNYKTLKENIRPISKLNNSRLVAIQKIDNSNQMRQRLDSYKRTQEVYEIEIRNFNKECNSLEYYQSSETASCGTKFIRKIEEECVQLSEGITKFKDKINEKNLNLQKFLWEKNKFLQFNEAQLNTLKAYFNVEIENLRERLIKAAKEKQQHQEHIKLLESTISCISNERQEEKRILSEKYERKLRDVGLQVDRIFNEKDQILEKLQESENIRINMVKHQNELEHKLCLNEQKIINLEKSIHEQQKQLESDKKSHEVELQVLRQIYEEKLSHANSKEEKISIQCNNLLVENENLKIAIQDLNAVVDKLENELTKRDVQHENETREWLQVEKKIRMLEKGHEEEIKTLNERILELEANYEKFKIDEQKIHNARICLLDQLKVSFDKSNEDHEHDLKKIHHDYDMKLKNMEKHYKKEISHIEERKKELSRQNFALKQENDRLGSELKKELEIKIHRERHHVDLIKKLRRRHELEKNCCC